VDNPDPELAQVGYVRAKKLAQILENQDIKHVFSTDYKRTRMTVQPTADHAGLSIQSYDPEDHDALVEQIRSLDGNILVVGHSNTVSRLSVTAIPSAAWQITLWVKMKNLRIFRKLNMILFMR